MKRCPAFLFRVKKWFIRKDIENREDISNLVNRFYEKVRQDDLIAHLSRHHGSREWERHLPLMYTFWENILFYTGGYGGNPMAVHDRLHRQYPLNKAHFNRWLELFTATVDELFEGEKARLARQRAEAIASMMQSRILPQPPSENIY